MKQRSKGILAFIFLGGIMLTSGVVLAFPGVDPNFGDEPYVDPNGNSDGESQRTITGTPADNFPDDQRARFCGSGIARSTDYVQEFSIPTVCSNPLGIVTDYNSNVWFAQTNTGNLAKFDPTTETFTEYDNSLWPAGARSMMWGIDYAPDGSIWYTDEFFDSVWKFSMIDESYNVLSYPSEGDSLPQRLVVDGSQIIINDFTGNKLTFLDPTLSGENINYLSIPSPLDDSLTADFALDKQDNVWFTTWVLQQGGVLVKFDYNAYGSAVIASSEEFLPLADFIEVYALPPTLLTPNGATVGDDGTVWLADTTSSSFFSFDPATEQFIQYVTADPLLDTYGNQTGIIKTPLSRPYWIDSDEQGRIIFNEQTANNISVMDPVSQSLVEYHVPSKNPNWSDCDPGTGIQLDNCGVAQIFDFTVDGHKIWFTEWVENNIGVVDTTVPLPIKVQPESDTHSLAPGNLAESSIMISSQKMIPDAYLVLSSPHDFLSVSSTYDTFEMDSDSSQSFPITISASDDAIPGKYKILVGVQLPDVAVSKYITVTIQ